MNTSIHIKHLIMILNNIRVMIIQILKEHFSIILLLMEMKILDHHLMVVSMKVLLKIMKETERMVVRNH